jgi:hypothetical protein
MLDIADHRDVAVDGAAVFHRFHRRRRNVDHDVALAEGEMRVLQALRTCSKLLLPLLGRDVHRFQRGSGDDACLSQPIAELEVLDRFG